MNKLKKGLKKKKGLFDPEQLAKYKREKELAAAQQQQQEGAAETSTSASSSKPEEANEEWQKFKLLTSGVDDILKKTSGELERIKSESYYQKKAPKPQRPSEQPHEHDHDAHDGRDHHDQRDHVETSATSNGVASQNQHQAEHQSHASSGHAIKHEHVAAQGPESVPAPVVEEEPIVLGDELFDTSFLDAIAAGEIKLAYIPDSPDDDGGEDPFDTSGVADVVKKIEEATKKEKRKVDLGIAVNFLTTTSSTTATKSTNESQATPPTNPAVAESVSKRSKRRALLNVNLLGTFDESGPLPVPSDVASNSAEKVKDIFDELDAESKNDESSNPEIELKPVAVPVVKSEADNLKNSGDDKSNPQVNLKELLSEFEEFPTSESSAPVVAPASSSGPVRQESSADEFDELALTSIHKAREEDPFDTSYVPPGLDTPESTGGGLLDDAHECGEAVSVPTKYIEKEKGKQVKAETSTPHPIDIEDPFDTSTLEVAAPCPTQLKLLEKEFLNEDTEGEYGPVKPSHVQIQEKVGRKFSVESDFEFDPRAGEQPPEQTIEEVEPHPLDAEHFTGEDDNALTPVAHAEEEPDPFDTSAVASSILEPGKLELRQLEEELTAPPEVVELPVRIPTDADDFFQSDDHSHSLGFVPLNPTQYSEASKSRPGDNAEFSSAVDESHFDDPFDTSSVLMKNIYTGKIEIKDIENELLNTKTDFKPPRPNIPQISLDKMSKKPEQAHPLDHAVEHEHATTPLKPVNSSFGSFGDTDDTDPFDTSIADFVRPSNTEIKLLEEELRKPHN